MKKLVLVVLIAAGGWWYFVGGRKLTEEHVNGFYRDPEIATLERKPEKLCTLLSDSFESAGTVTVAGQSRSTDTLIRKNGKVLLRRSEGRGSIGGGS